MNANGNGKPNFEYRVGFFTFVAVLLLLYGWGWLKSIDFMHPPQRFTVQFHDIAGLNNNAPVNVNGVRVGTVEKLDLKGKGQVLVRVKINTENVTIPAGSNFTIQTLGLVGAKYMEISLPEEKTGEPPPAPLDPSSVVIGQDPVRVELVMNKMATNLSHIDFTDVEANFNKKLERMANAADSVEDAAHRFGAVADNAKDTAKSADQFFAKGTAELDKIGAVTNELKTTARSADQLAQAWIPGGRKFSRMMDNPNISGDLKAAMEKAHETAKTIQAAVHEFNTSLTDKQLRDDILAMLNRVNQSADSVNKSLQIVHDVAGDRELRTEVKDMLNNARVTMDKIDTVLNKPGVAGDARQTMAQLRTTAADLDTVAQQMHQVLDEKRPLWKMLTGTPGRLKQKKEEKALVKSSVGKEASKAGVPEQVKGKDNQEVSPPTSLPTAEQNVQGAMPGASPASSQSAPITIPAVDSKESPQ